MKLPLKILFVEDNPKHLADLKQVLDVELPRQPVEITPLYASSLTEAVHLLEEVDAVMADVFFPSVIGEKEEGNGQAIVELCLNREKPVVWITSTYHHGPKTNDLNDWGRDHGLEMYDCYDPQSQSGDGNNEAEHKPWKRALLGLLYTITAVEIGFAIFKDHCLVQSRNGEGLRHRVYEIGYHLEKGDFSKEPVLDKMKEEGFPLD